MSLFARLQQSLPQHGLSRFAGHLANAASAPFARALVRAFIARYDVDLSDAERTSAADYATFNDFFTRSLKPDARPMPADPNAVACPADGYLSQFGALDGDRLLQAKGQRYSVTSLVADSAVGRWLDGGTFVTVYLSPRDYHRVHAPAAATLVETLAVPGALFSVNASTEAGIGNLFCRNERLVCVFDRYVVVLVGALLVASIETSWPGPQSPYRQHTRTRVAPRTFERGEEIGYFSVGSTVIVLFPPGSTELHDNLGAGTSVRMGESLGIMRDPSGRA